ncbi:MAG: hypothetical protein MN733_19055 [Nitrososphaera sp.]|nr:hypothetical protein [Nitrososphaera sp.]
MKDLLTSLVVISASLYTQQALALTANDVRCRGCIGASDIATSAVRSKDIANNTITYDDLGTAVRPIVVVDSAGKQVGRTMGVDQVKAWVLLTVNGVNVSFVVRRYSYSSNSNPSKYYTSTDCSGVEYFSAPGINNFPSVTPSFIGGPANATVYVFDQSSPVTISSGSAYSFIDSDGEGEGCIAGTANEDIDGLVTSVPLVDLDTLFTPPFDIR